MITMKKPSLEKQINFIGKVPSLSKLKGHKYDICIFKGVPYVFINSEWTEIEIDEDLEEDELIEAVI